MTKAKLVFFLFLAAFIGFTSQLSSYSDGPPTARTGAPGELTCFNGYCHNSFQLNSGPGYSRIDSDIPSAGYAPGETYDITLTVAHPDMKRFGFQLLPFSPLTESLSGEIVLSSPDKTKLEEDKGRTYIMHDTAQAIMDSASWNFQWKAPPQGSGNVVFYWAFVASDSSENRAGDYVYKSNQEFAENLTASNFQDLSAENHLRIVNQPGQPFRFSSPDKLIRNLQVEVRDIQGRRISSWQGDLGTQEVEIPLETTGVYLVWFRQGQKQWGRKVLR